MLWVAKNWNWTSKWGIHEKCLNETDPGSPFQYAPSCSYWSVYWNVFWNHCKNTQYLSIWWLCLKKKKKTSQKISSRMVDNRVTEKENEISSSAVYQSISHILYCCALNAQLHLYHLLNSRPLPRCLWASLVVIMVRKRKVDSSLQICFINLQLCWLVKSGRLCNAKCSCELQK